MPHPGEVITSSAISSSSSALRVWTVVEGAMMNEQLVSASRVWQGNK
jgi:hypothetical protein